MPDPERSTELLWGTRARRGLDLDTIVRTAIDLADREGLGAVSMRRVAEVLGFTTMSLYRHVPGKAELLDLMRDAVTTPPGDEQPADWRSGLEAWARAGLALYQRHPWLIESSGPRAVPGPNAVAQFERALSIVAATGLPPAQIVAVVTLVGGFVESAARQVVHTIAAERESGLTHEEFWGARDSLYEHLDRYPTLSRIYEQGGYDEPLDPFEFGLQRVLDGVATLVRDEKRDESWCVVCGDPVAVTGKGRPKEYCSRACQQKAYRKRTSAPGRDPG
ncbi:TetR/AcrR family transcriptional regulator [Kibdelosporangium persicum]|uniref:Tetracycline repressor protein class B from transposon Tn10 n=1 Tax=Kibdelosporangium persicum TaxID=2698649 RepID=A0ABX2F1W7_9PSEU|nr:TetR/AcrR family transcriptional regulator [Kibdelosporangium persicum]NRN65331.1 Tetracycline repressor protein class B from transposon Tn10 [Kibdelosporangium persicum]